MCASIDFECGYSDDGMEAVELYCTNFEGTVPVDCSMTFLHTMDTMNKSQVVDLKIGGCEHDNVQQFIDNFPNLRSLDMSYSGIECLDSFNLKHEKIAIVNVSHNRLIEVPMKFFSQLPAIVEIDFSFNDLSKIDEVPVKLRKIYLSHNKFAHGFFSDFSGLKSLEYLDLSNNAITRIGAELISTDGKKPKKLLLENNPIVELGILLSSLVQKGVLVHMSWKNFTRFMCFMDDQNIRVSLNSGKSGMFRTTNGNLELHCNENSFENAIMFTTFNNRVENPKELLHCLTPRLHYLTVRGNFKKDSPSDETLDFKLIQRFDQLVDLTLQETPLTNFDLNLLQNHKKLISLRVTGSNLKRMDNFEQLQNFQELKYLDLSGNRLENWLGIIQHLNARNVFHLNLNGNTVGKIDEETFAEFSYLNYLYLADTNLSLDDLKPFEPLSAITELDISNNDLGNMDFTTSLLDLKELHVFNAAYCQIRNISGLAKRIVAPSMWGLDLTGNFLDDLPADSFESWEELMSLNISRINLTHFDFGIFDHNPAIQLLDLSQNQLTNVNFTSNSSHLMSLHLNGNNINIMENFTKSKFPELKQLDIWMNWFSCEYLATFVPQIKKEWPKLEFLHDPWQQKHGNNCH